jgi:hypothetical protein
MHLIKVDVVGLVAVATASKIRESHAVPGAH